MIFFYVILFVIVLASLKYKGTNSEYISVQQTNVIKGVFIWLVFMGHIMPYIADVIPLESFIDRAGPGVVRILQQLVVVPFLFYSGYGVTNSIKNKGQSYVDSIPKKRVLNTMLNFGVAVSFFILLNWLLDIPMNLKQILLSFVCWDSIGNSNWYILTICICYLSSYFSYKLLGYTRSSLIANVVFLFVYILIISKFKGSWWYDTCLAYSAGCIFCFYKERVEDIIGRNYWLCTLIIGGLFAVSYLASVKIYVVQPLFMNICSIFFSFSLVLLSLKFQLRSKILEWSGKNLFSLYIYQRIPMILFSTICGGYLVTEWRYVYVVTCAVVSIVIVHLYKYITIKFISVNTNK